MTLRTFYAYEHEAPDDADPLPDPVDDRHSIKWGYNLVDLDRLARIAASRSYGRGSDPIDRYQAAWSAIAEALCAAETAPDPSSLIHAGWSAATNHGGHLAREDGHDCRTGRDMPRFHQYWTPAAHTPVEDRIVDALALWQILPCLSDRQRQAFTALAAAETYQSAAAALEMTDRAFSSLIIRARAAFLTLWHDGETPSKVWRRDQRQARSGNRITASQLETIRARYLAGETQAAIAADYGVSRDTITKLLAGKNKPAPDPEESS